MATLRDVKTEKGYKTSGERAEQPRICIANDLTSPAGLVSGPCIDCDGTGRYPSGATCKSCVGERVVWDYGKPIS